MAQAPNCAIAPVLTVIDGKATTLSTDVARHFGKRHDDVLRAISNLCAQLDKERLRNFAETVETRPNPSGGAPIESRAYRLTRDGFTLLAMGFTGKRALQFNPAAWGIMCLPRKRWCFKHTPTNRIGRPISAALSCPNSVKVLGQVAPAARRGSITLVDVFDTCPTMLSTGVVDQEISPTEYA